MTLQAPPWRTGQEAVTRGKTNHFLIQRGQSNALNPSNLHRQRELVSPAAGVQVVGCQCLLLLTRTHVSSCCS